MIGWGKVALSVDVHRGARAVCVAIAFRLSPCGVRGCARARAVVCARDREVLRTALLYYIWIL